jgi:formamidopyrimidine-DNA glycosylase
MPELPEVETTRRGLDMIITGKRLLAVHVHEARMRWPVTPELNLILQGKQLLACERRGKYLLLRFEHGTLLVHLGMSGSLRHVQAGEFLRKHDHVEWCFDGVTVRLNDPRRFGAVLWHDHATGPVAAHPLLAGLGIEPFDVAFTPQMLHAGLQGRSVAIKQALLAGQIVVGVGNIYASESLFAARIHPRTPANRISPARAQRLHAAILSTLEKALDSGGSTLRNYTGTQGEPGAYFEIHAAVYDRVNQPCRSCGTPIRKIVQGQRATFFCPKCQRY